ncbi:MAG TPA: TolC family protein [Desulfuromonadales bacterium]|nr:TolC family protein [Desulfuromonadales bacterium]
MRKTVFSKRAVALFVTICSWTFGATAYAEEKVFSLAQAVDFSLQNNGELMALREERGIREAGRSRAGLYPNPVLEADGTTGKLTGSPSENTLTVGISQEFPTAGKRGKRLLAAEKELEGFDRQLDNAGRLLAAEVKAAFYDLLLAQQKVELAQRSLALNNRLLEVAGQRFEAGDIPELEVNLARVEAARSEGRKAEAEREIVPARARLLVLLGLPSETAAGFTGSLEESSGDVGELAELKALALAQRSDLAALEAQKAQVGAEVQLAKAERIPNLTAGIAYTRENTATDIGDEEIKDADNLVGLRLAIPIPLFDRNQAGIREAVARKGSTEARALFARQSVEREVETAHARLTGAEKIASLYAGGIIPQLEENLKLVQEAYQIGEIGILTVIEEQKKFVEVHENYLAALYGRQTARAELEKAVGGSLDIETSGGAQ